MGHRGFGFWPCLESAPQSPGGSVFFYHQDHHLSKRPRAAEACPLHAVGTQLVPALYFYQRGRCQLGECGCPGTEPGGLEQLFLGQCLEVPRICGSLLDALTFPGHFHRWVPALVAARQDCPLGDPCGGEREAALRVGVGEGLGLIRGAEEGVRIPSGYLAMILEGSFLGDELECQGRPSEPKNSWGLNLPGPTGNEMACCLGREV